ncbi:MAG: hypothetical protein ACLRXC_04790, partial [[Clostridium] leptum]
SRLFGRILSASGAAISLPSLSRQGYKSRANAHAFALSVASSQIYSYRGCFSQIAFTIPRILSSFGSKS